MKSKNIFKINTEQPSEIDYMKFHAHVSNISDDLKELSADKKITLMDYDLYESHLDAIAVKITMVFEYILFDKFYGSFKKENLDKFIADISYHLDELSTLCFNHKIS